MRAIIDKSKLLHHIEDLVKENAGTEDNTLADTKKVTIIDWMAVVNQVQKTKEMITCEVSISLDFL